MDSNEELIFGNSNVNDDSFLSRDRKMVEWRNKLPHIHQERTEQFLTFRLSDSLPQRILNEIKEMRQIFEANNPKPWSEEVMKKSKSLYNDKVNYYLDSNYGSCILGDMTAAKLFEKALFNEHNVSCEIVAYVVMPNHVHILMLPFGENSCYDIIKRVMGRASYLINKYFGKKVISWNKEIFDRMVRNADHHENVMNYILKNWNEGGILCDGTQIVKF